MNYRQLGRSDLLLSEIGVGCEQLGGIDWGAVKQAEVMEAVARASDIGMNFFDSADVYGLGRSEELLGIALRDKR